MPTNWNAEIWVDASWRDIFFGHGGGLQSAQKTLLRGKKWAAQAGDRLIGENPHWVSLPVCSSFFSLRGSNGTILLFFQLCSRLYTKSSLCNIMYVKWIVYVCVWVQPHLFLLLTFIERQSLAKEEPVQSRGTCSLHHPPVPALISNMSSHHHRWLQRKHFLGRWC